MFFTYAEIDRTITDIIRLAAVQAGYLPDITAMADAAAYATAKQAVRDSGKQVIEVYGVGTGKSRDEKSINKITIDRKGGEPGTIGGWPSTFFVSQVIESQTQFNKYFYPDQTKNIKYEIRCIGAKAEYYRIMEEIIHDNLGMQKFLVAVDATTGAPSGKFFYIEQTAEVDVSSADFLETYFQYSVKDVFITAAVAGGKLIRANIVPLTDVEVTVVNGDGTPDTGDFDETISITEDTPE